jgi:UPF0755 protein
MAADREPELYQVKRGSGFYANAEELSRLGMIRSLRFFKALGKFNDASTRIKAGYYEIRPGMSSSEILELIMSGRVHTVRVTIPEGYDNRLVAKRLLNHGMIKNEEEFLKIAADGGILAEYGLPPAKTSEGFLFPDTYLFPWGATPRELVGMMVGNFKHQVGSSLIARMQASPVGFLNSLTLASIVEREARRPEERPRIAGVFLNRFKIGMKFESCATIQYVLGKVVEKLYYYQLKIKSPYNTYENAGFPPGPIANPGLASIRAAAEPESHDFLFFVAKQDGSHHFSRSGQEHNRAAQRYQWSRD